MLRALIGAVAAVCLSGMGCAGTREAASPPPASTAAVPSFHWVAGQWIDAAGTGRFEEHWMAERGDAMIGVFRLIGRRGPIVYEFIRVAEADARVVMEITHFNGDGTVWPNQPVVFRSTALEDDRIVFAQDGVPDKVLTYERTGSDTMRVTLADPADAQPAVFEFRRVE
jgi:hypothetical protein